MSVYNKELELIVLMFFGSLLLGLVGSILRNDPMLHFFGGRVGLF